MIYARRTTCSSRSPASATSASKSSRSSRGMMQTSFVKEQGRRESIAAGQGRRESIAAGQGRRESIAAGLPILCLFSVASCYRVAEQPNLAGQDVRLTVLHTSDLHSRLLP